MRFRNTLPLLIAFCAALPFSSHATPIDNFSADQSVITQTIGEPQASTIEDPEIAGGRRTVTVELSDGTAAGILTRKGEKSNFLSYQSFGGSSGSGTVSWGGADAKINLTPDGENALLVFIASAEVQGKEPVKIAITLKAGDASATTEYKIDSTIYYRSLLIPLETFSSTVDLSKVSSIEIQAAVGIGNSLTLGCIATIDQTGMGSGIWYSERNLCLNVIPKAESSLAYSPPSASVGAAATGTQVFTCGPDTEGKPCARDDGHIGYCISYGCLDCNGEDFKGGDQDCIKTPGDYTDAGGGRYSCKYQMEDDGEHCVLADINGPIGACINGKCTDGCAGQTPTECQKEPGWTYLENGALTCTFPIKPDGTPCSDNRTCIKGACVAGCGASSRYSMCPPPNNGMRCCPNCPEGQGCPDTCQEDKDETFCRKQNTDCRRFVSAGGCWCNPIPQNEGGACKNGTGKCDDYGECIPNPKCTSDNDCTEGNACTEASCDTTTGECSYPEKDCDDGDACTVDFCEGDNGCKHEPRICDDDNECTVDSCDKADGCYNNPVAQGTSCNEGAGKCVDGSCITPECEYDTDCEHDACSTAHCNSEFRCENAPLDCDDGNECSEDSCDPSNGCFSTPIDGAQCNGGSGECASGSCQPYGCSSAEDCPHDSCNTVECINRQCVPTEITCDDSDACTEDYCDGNSGCYHEDRNCDDENECTEDSCEISNGCYHNSLDGNQCNEGAGVCSGSSCQPVGCESSADCAGDECTSVECVDHQCVATSISCDDGDACTTDSCDPSAGGCGHSALNCDDGDSCTVDSCDTQSGCVYSSDPSCESQCNSNDECPSDACNTGICQDGKCTSEPISCESTDFCTVASCDPSSGCVTSPRDCDDGNSCTDDSCDSRLNSCVNTAIEGCGE